MRRPSAAWATAVYLIAALTLFVLSGLGLFEASATLPLIVGPLLALIGAVQAVRGRGQGTAARGLILAGALVALAAPAAQWLYLRARAARVERAVLAELRTAPAPRLAHDLALNADPGETPIEPASGRLTIVNFWGTWCAPCVKELPLLAKFARTHDPSTVRMVGFTRFFGADTGRPEAEELAEIESFLADQGVGYLNLVERGRAVHEAYGVTRWPSTVLVGVDGRVLDFGIGIRGSKRILRGAERRLKGAAEGPVTHDRTSKGDDLVSQAEQDRRVDYIEFATTDIEEIKRFYSEVFGWRFTDYGPDYTSFSDGRLAGGFGVAPEVSAGGPLVVLYSTNLAEIEERVRESGGRIVREAFEFPGGRRFHFTDPSGNELAVWSDR